MSNQLMTAEEAFSVAMNEYPLLFASKSLRASRFMYFDHMFNVIGNGFRDFEEWVQKHTINEANEEWIKGFPDKYIGGNALYVVYLKAENMNGFMRPDINSKVKGLLTQEEVNNISEVKVKHEVRMGEEEVSPYPNFKKEFSLVWRVGFDLEKMDISWLYAAKEYYGACKEYFQSDCQSYYGAAAKDENKMLKDIKEFEKAFEELKEENQSKEAFYSKISKEYDQAYDGDTRKFIENKWVGEKARINAFIDETLTMLDEKIALRARAAGIRKKMN